MTLDESLQPDTDEKADLAYALWAGQRPITVEPNYGEDWQEKPVILIVDGQAIHLTAEQADNIGESIRFALLDFSQRKLELEGKQSAETQTGDPF